MPNVAIKIGLRHPSGRHLLPGPKDKTTVKQQLQALKNQLGLENFTFVGDRGMVTHARIEELEKEGWWDSFRYITALTRQEMMALVEEETHPIQLELFDHQHLVEVEEEGTRYRRKMKPSHRRPAGSVQRFEICRAGVSHHEKHGHSNPSDPPFQRAPSSRTYLRMFFGLSDRVGTAAPLEIRP